MPSVEDFIFKSRIDGEARAVFTMLNEPTWKDLLIESVRRKKIDPWNIDIELLVNGYLETIRNIEVIDLSVPANVILAASILLRFKVEFMQAEEPEEEPVEYRQIPEVNPLVPRMRMPQNKRITLQELLEALEEAMRVKEARVSNMHVEESHITININDSDIEKDADELMDLMLKEKDSYGLVSFSSISANFSGEAILFKAFIPMLFLAHKGKVVLIQEEFFGEIIIKVV
ncbi:MAG: hypothetical protein QXL16_02375 [Candidatus Micrarchaeaceae archaeon]